MISIIIPIYNSASYLDACIGSVLGQTFSDLELILVDDGSTDASGEIAGKWEERDSRVRYFRRQNGGVSSARNFGIAKARGEYVMFVDSDDLCDKELARTLHDLMKSGNHDLAACSVKRFLRPEELDNALPDSETGTRGLRGKDAIYRYMEEGGLLHPPYAKLYRKEFITENAIKFDETLSLGEDMCFNLDYLEHVDSAAFTRRALYGYRDTAGSLSKAIRGDYADIQLHLFDRKLRFIRENKVTYDYSPKAAGMLRDMFLSLCRSEGSDRGKEDSLKRLKKHKIMKMAQKGASLPELLLISAIRFFPVRLLLKIIR